MPKKKKKPRVKKNKSLSRSLPASGAETGDDFAERPAQHKGGGGLMALRSGFKKVAGTGGPPAAKSTVSKVFDVILWIVVAAALGFFFYRRYG